MTDRDEELRTMALQALATLHREYRRAAEPYAKILADIEARYPKPIFLLYPAALEQPK